VITLAVAAGGVLGAVARLGASEAIDGGAWVTLLVNLTGCLALGLGGRRASGLLRPFLVTGVLGGYTTFSAFAVDVDRLLADGRLLAAVAYAAASVGLGIAVARP
jgi:CrcB protein